MDPHKLVSMANAIAAFYDAEPRHEDAVAGVASHLDRFWDPRMRRDLVAFIDRGGNGTLQPTVRDAVAARREAWRAAGVLG